MIKRASYRPLMDLVVIGVGPMIWFGYFSLMYGAETWACSDLANADTRMMWFGAVTTAGALMALSAAAALQVRRFGAGLEASQNSSFMRFTALACTGLAAIAVIWTAFPLFLIRPCFA